MYCSLKKNDMDCLKINFFRYLKMKNIVNSDCKNFIQYSLKMLDIKEQIET